MNIELKERSRDDLLEIISAKDMKSTMQKIEIKELEKEIEKLNKRIDKAIKECEQDVKDIWKWEGAYMEMFEAIADILKGSDKK